MGSKRVMSSDEAEVGAELLRQMKAIATKEVEHLPVGIVHTFFLDETRFLSSRASEEESDSDARRRAVSVESIDMVTSALSPVLSSKSISFFSPRSSLPATPEGMEHYDWSKRASSPSDACASLSFSPTPKGLIMQKYGKRKRESFVGQTSKSGVVRATLRKKFSWKQFPEVSALYTKIVVAMLLR